VATSVSSIDDLNTRIMELEKVQSLQMAELKLSAVGVMESLSPSNLLRGALKDVTQSPDIRRTAINTAIGIGVGFVGKKMFVGNSSNVFKKIAGSAVQFLIANFVRKKIPDIKEHNTSNNNHY
jgi:hypothetical protein